MGERFGLTEMKELFGGMLAKQFFAIYERSESGDE